jgi:hypothetical protein
VELNSILQAVFDPNPLTRITLSELRNRIMSCPRLTNAPTAMDSPPLSEISDASDYQMPVEFIPESPLTPPDSAPATPHCQSAQDPFNYAKPLVSYPSDNSFVSQYYDAPLPESDVVPVPPMDYVTHESTESSSSFWQFPFLRRNVEVDKYISRLVQPQHGGVRVF